MTEHSANGVADVEGEVEIVGDIGRALEIAEEQGRVVVTREGHAPVALIPLDDLRLLLRLEEAELDRIDTEDVRSLKESGEFQDRVAWDDVKTLSRV